MEILGAVAAVVAALAALVGVAFGKTQLRDARKRRLTEIADLVEELRVGVEFGQNTADRHRTSAVESVELARDASREIRRELGEAE